MLTTVIFVVTAARVLIV